MTTIGAALLGGAWLWDKFGEKVVEQAGKLGGGAGLQAWKKINWKTSAERYRGEMQLRYGIMRIIGMAEPVALADIFTDVVLLDKPSAWRRYNIEELTRQIQQLDQHDTSREKRHDALDLVRRHERLMILGKPGAGKTTLLKHLVLQCTTGRMDAVPILVGLKAWADSGLELMPFLARQFAICAFPDAQQFISHILAEGRALVLFDGLDEVNLEQGARERITWEVRDLADQFPDSRCVITCRTAASDYQFERFSYGELADFTEEQMRTFVGHWFQRDEAKREAFLTEFAKAEHDRLRDLARTPLLLTLLCLTFEETITFPPRRAEIYEEALDALLKKWDATRSIKRDTIYRHLSLGHKRQMLARIAAETFAQDNLFIHQSTLVGQILEYMQRLPPSDIGEDIDGDVILRSIEAQHGLLVERAQKIYSFSHLTFHEYFAARYIVEHPSQDMFRSIVGHAQEVRWREVFLLTASMLDDANAATFFDAFDAALRAMIQIDPALLLLFQWLQRKAEQIAPADSGTTRQAYVALALITTSVSSFLEILIRAHARDWASGITLAQALARDLALGRGRSLPRDLTSARDLARTIASPVASDLARTSDLAHASALARILDLARFRDVSMPIMIPFQTDCVWTGILLWAQVLASIDSDNRVVPYYSELRDIWHGYTASAEPQLGAVLRTLILPEQNMPAEDWKQFAADLQATLVTHRDIGYSWILDRTQPGHLADYFEASTRMLECLDLAAVADRDAIRNRLLLPPQP